MKNKTTSKNINSEYSDFDKNISEKSIIFAPFNSSFSQYNEENNEVFKWPEYVLELLEQKKSKIV